MKTMYMGPDGELYNSEGPQRTRMSKLTALSEEFALFREGWYKAKMNDIVNSGFSNQSQDSIEIIKLCNIRRRTIEN